MQAYASHITAKPDGAADRSPETLCAVLYLPFRILTDVIEDVRTCRRNFLIRRVQGVHTKLQGSVTNNRLVIVIAIVIVIIIVIVIVKQHHCSTTGVVR